MRRVVILMGLVLSATMATHALGEPLALASCAKFTAARDTKAALSTAISTASSPRGSGTGTKSG